MVTYIKIYTPMSEYGPKRILCNLFIFENNFISI